MRTYKNETPQHTKREPTGRKTEKGKFLRLGAGEAFIPEEHTILYKFSVRRCQFFINFPCGIVFNVKEIYVL